MDKLVSKNPLNPLYYLGYGPPDVYSKSQLPPAGTDLNLPPNFGKHQPVFVCLDVEGSCAHPSSHSLAEIGIAVLDTRDVLTLPAGDRGRGWHSKIRKWHIRTEEYRHDRHLHGVLQSHVPWCKGDPGLFAFGASTMIKKSNIRRYLEDWFKNISQRNLRKDETQRRIILLTFASSLEESKLRFHEVGWFINAQEAWDVQKMQFARRLHRQLDKPHVSVRDLLDHTRVAYEQHLFPLNPDVREPRLTEKERNGDRLLHNGGNDAAFELQGMLASLLMTREQHQQSLKDGPDVLPLLPKSWDPAAMVDNSWRFQ